MVKENFYGLMVIITKVSLYKIISLVTEHMNSILIFLYKKVGWEKIYRFMKK